MRNRTNSDNDDAAMLQTAQHHQQYDRDNNNAPCTLHLGHMQIQTGAHNALSFVFAYERKCSQVLFKLPSCCGYTRTGYGYNPLRVRVRVPQRHTRHKPVPVQTGMGFVRVRVRVRVRVHLRTSGGIPVLLPNNDDSDALTLFPGLL